MLGSRLAARDAITPFWIHIFEIEVVRLEHMHIAIENLESVSGHGLPSSFFLGAYLAGYCILPEPFSVNREAVVVQSESHNTVASRKIPRFARNDT